MSQDTWVPLSIRTGARQPFAPVEGVPDFLWGYLREWIEDAIGDDAPTAIQLDLTLRLNAHNPFYGTRGGMDGTTITDALGARPNPILVLDVIDWLLHHGTGSAVSLEAVLASGRRAWSPTATASSSAWTHPRGPCTSTRPAHRTRRATTCTRPGR